MPSELKVTRYARNLRSALCTAPVAGALIVLVAFFPKSPRVWPLVKKTVRTRFPSVPQLLSRELEDWLAAADRAKPLLLDARKAKEYTVSHLPDAQLTPSEQDALRTLSGIGKDHPIVAYCSGGYRSAALAERLQAQGFTNVYNLEGSIFEWANEGRPVYRMGTKVDVVHPYNGFWGRLLQRRLWPTSPAFNRSTSE